MCGSPDYGVGTLSPGRCQALGAVRCEAWSRCEFLHKVHLHTQTSFKQGHRVTEECRHEDLIKLREGVLLLLDKVKQVTLAWVNLWENVDAGQGEEEQFPQMEEVQLEEAGMQVSPELDEWEATARECVDLALKQNAIETRARRNEWVNSAIEGGARKAHAFSKTLVPDLVQHIHSVQCASLIANTSVLAAEKKKLQELWMSRESSSAHGTTLTQRTCLPTLAPDTIRRAAREFSTHTATSTDGFAMRHFAPVSDAALVLVSQLFECTEALGTIPQELRCVLVVLIPKATTGLRPTGIFCALYRLWAKCRPAIAQEWENLHTRSFFAPAKEGQLPTHSGGMRLRWSVVTTEARRQCRCGETLHNYMSA